MLPILLVLLVILLATGVLGGIDARAVVLSVLIVFAVWALSGGRLR